MAHILLIEDEEPLRKMLREFLEMAGHTVTEARNGKEGLTSQQLSPADLVITDLIMPEKEGIETIIELRKKYRTLKIIAMSGGGRVSSNDYLQIAKQLGAQRTFAKPFSGTEMVAGVNEVLGMNTTT